MPLPILPILIGIGAATGALGIGKGIKAAVDNSDAKDYNKQANDLISVAKDSLEKARQASNTALEALGSKKLYIWDNSIVRFFASFEKIKNVQLEDSTGLHRADFARLGGKIVSRKKLNSRLGGKALHRSA